MQLEAQDAAQKLARQSLLVVDASEQAALANAAAKLIAAWDLLEDRKRELRGIPKSGARRPSEEKAKKRSRASANVIRMDSPESKTTGEQSQCEAPS